MLHKHLDYNNRAVDSVILSFSYCLFFKIIMKKYPFYEGLSKFS